MVIVIVIVIVIVSVIVIVIVLILTRVFVLVTATLTLASSPLSSLWARLFPLIELRDKPKVRGVKTVRGVGFCLLSFLSVIDSLFSYQLYHLFVVSSLRDGFIASVSFLCVTVCACVRVWVRTWVGVCK